MRGWLRGWDRRRGGGGQSGRGHIGGQRRDGGNRSAELSLHNLSIETVVPRGDGGVGGDSVVASGVAVGTCVVDNGVV